MSSQSSSYTGSIIPEGPNATVNTLTFTDPVLNGLTVNGQSQVSDTYLQNALVAVTQYIETNHNLPTTNALSQLQQFLATYYQENGSLPPTWGSFYENLRGYLENPTQVPIQAAVGDNVASPDMANAVSTYLNLTDPTEYPGGSSLSAEATFETLMGKFLSSYVPNETLSTPIPNTNPQQILPSLTTLLSPS